MQRRKERKVEDIRVAAGAHLSIPWLFELAKHPDDTADYCFGYAGVLVEIHVQVSMTDVMVVEKKCSPSGKYRVRVVLLNNV